MVQDGRTDTGKTYKQVDEGSALIFQTQMSGTYLKLLRS
jgi:hypothetical protein